MYTYLSLSLPIYIYIYIYTHIYIYIYIYSVRQVALGKRFPPNWTGQGGTMANLRTKIMDFRVADSSIISILRGGIPMSVGDLPDSLSQAILVGIMLVGRLLAAQPSTIGAGVCDKHKTYIYIYIYICI